MRVCCLRRPADPHGSVVRFSGVCGMCVARRHVSNGHLVARTRARNETGSRASLCRRRELLVGLQRSQPFDASGENEEIDGEERKV